MIFVTVGNATQGFRRLLEATDRAAGDGLFGDDPVFIQTGNNEGFRAAHCRQEPFIEIARFEELVRTATLVISHGGAGTLIHLLKIGKTPIVMPRRQQYSEHVDDHQFELVKALADERRVIPVFEAEELAAAVNSARQWNPQSRANSSPPIVRLVAEAIEELAAKRNGGR